MIATTSPSYCAFLGWRRLAEGPLTEVARAAAVAQAGTPDEPLLVFDPEGRQVDLDLRGTPDEAAARAGSGNDAPAAPAPASPPLRGRGRPQLGVVAREVTLLPRHWEWLAAQPGGASVTLRRLVEGARREGGAQPERVAQERAYRFLHAIGGNLPGYENALRALFARDADRFGQALSEWPQDIRAHAQALAAGAFEAEARA
ncbi:DUF2239 family protein [Ramlibacter sp.]|uniref:DUF2239 family protein n=1 Tax=Ramlibacter sp. TaxID=1917967 RepID=UPI002605B491|nr:DUF2239 family protein [Ramlibacter sp.]MDB5958121.1 hypothetical protein [Ramlibacter sp.]